MAIYTSPDYFERDGRQQSGQIYFDENVCHSFVKAEESPGLNAESLISIDGVRLFPWSQRNAQEDLPIEVEEGGVGGGEGGGI
jgi:hypothetical protein